MPKKEYALAPGEPKRLTLSWSMMWRDFEVQLDGQTIGTIDGQSALKEGRDFPLGDGTTLHIQLVVGLTAELHVTRDGAPLPGTSSDPEQRVKAAGGVVFFIAGINAVLGLLVVFFGVGTLERLGFGWGNLVTGLIYAGLAYAVSYHRSALALGVAVALFALDAVFSVTMAVSSGGSPPIGGLIARGLLLLSMVRGFGAIRELKRRPDFAMADIPADVASRGTPWEPPRRG